jgi:hypothetical protein
MIILIDTEDKIIEVDHTSEKVLTFNTLAEVLMVFNSYKHISLKDYKKNVAKEISNLKYDLHDVKPKEPNMKK